MNIPSSEVRKIIDDRFGQGIFSAKPGKSALLKDRAYTLPDEQEFIDDNRAALGLEAFLFEKRIEDLHEIYAEEQFDCDDRAELRCALIKMMSRKRSMRSGVVKKAYPVFQCALESNHTVAIVITKQGIRFAEPQNDKIWKADEQQEKILQID